MLKPLYTYEIYRLIRPASALIEAWKCNLPPIKEFLTGDDGPTQRSKILIVGPTNQQNSQKTNKQTNMWIHREDKPLHKSKHILYKSKYHHTFALWLTKFGIKRGNFQKFFLSKLSCRFYILASKSHPFHHSLTDSMSDRLTYRWPQDPYIICFAYIGPSDKYTHRRWAMICLYLTSDSFLFWLAHIFIFPFSFPIVAIPHARKNTTNKLEKCCVNSVGTTKLCRNGQNLL